MKKTLLSLILTICLIMPLAFVFTACKEPENEPPKAEAQSKVMVLSLNPTVEFVLDKDNKVVSVNATTKEGDVAEEGNLIISQVDFIGKTAEETVDLYLEVLENNGYIVSGKAMGQNFKIEISGDEAQSLYNKVHAVAEDFLSEANITLNISFEKITKEEVQKLVADCFREYSSYLELNNYSEKDLINMLKESRDETKELESEELKELYYEARALEILIAKIDSMKETLSLYIIDENERIEFLQNVEIIKSQLNNMYLNYKNFYLEESQEYKIKLDEYIEAKKALLEAQKYGISQSGILFEEAENLLNEAKRELSTAKNNAETQFTDSIGQLQILVASMSSMIDSFSALLNNELMQQAVTNAIESFKTDFATSYQEQINNKYWEGLTPQDPSQ